MKRGFIPWGMLLVAGLLLVGVLALKMRYPFEASSLQDYGASAVLLDRHGEPLRVRLGANEQDSRPVAQEHVSEWAVKALIAAEDKRFMSHRGIDLTAMLRAVCQNVFYGRRISGASTISTQVIRLAEPRRRNIETKLIEASQAMQMETILTKHNILEQYLNRAPFGSNLVGIESASRMYFGKSAGDLSLAEAAMLMGLPQSPTRLRPDRHPAAARKRMSYVLGRMEACGSITAEQRMEAEHQPVKIGINRRLFAAPHFADMVLQQTQHSGTIQTTLDRDMQAQAEKTLQAHFEILSDQGVHGAAVVVMEVKTGAVRALIGSPDYFDSRYAGAVNSALAARSPGSALKPFIYAMALEQGIITPGARIKDDPLYFRDSTPVNFDGTYRGDVSIRDALILSLNIPALKLTRQLGQHRVVDTLRELGLSTLQRPGEDYGLGIALGGGEIRLLDLVNAYACLARGGNYLPYRVLENKTQPAIGETIFSPETAYMVADILGGTERSMDLFGHIGDACLPRIAWKTGTSSGFRDAWTVAWNPEYVVGVWLGNPDGDGASVLVGANAAAPIAGDVFRTLYPAGNSVWFEKPEALSRRMLADGTQEWFVPGISKAPDPPQKTPALHIISPIDGSSYRIGTGEHARQEIELKAAATTSKQPIHWYANGEHIGSADAEHPLYWPLKEGSWTFSCAAGSRVDQSKITVKRSPFDCQQQTVVSTRSLSGY